MRLGLLIQRGCAVFLIANISGCVVLQDYRPAAILVRDAESKKPIPAAEVRVSYPTFASSFAAPIEPSALTADDGIARLQAACYGDGLTLTASAKGYLTENLDVAVSAVQKIERAHWFEAKDRRPPNFIVDLYCEPAFTVELIVPVGFRGVIKATVNLQTDAPSPAGQRSFAYPVSSLGLVDVNGPLLLQRVLPQTYHAKYADGTPVGTEMDSLKVGFRWLKQSGKEYYFVVGTKYEFESFSRELLAEERATAGPSRDGAKGSGRGGRHRRSTPGSAD
jgi:hypothetical protein